MSVGVLRDFSVRGKSDMGVICLGDGRSVKREKFHRFSSRLSPLGASAHGNGFLAVPFYLERMSDRRTQFYSKMHLELKSGLTEVAN